MKRVCAFINCQNHATFRKFKGDPEYCRKHFPEGYVPLSGNYQTCQIKNCRYYASHGLRGGIYKLCAKHSDVRIHINRRYTLCHFPGCQNRRNKNKFCGEHKKVSLPDSYLTLVKELEGQVDETTADESTETY